MQAGPGETIKDRWELPFIYGFVIRFTMLKKRMALFNTSMDLEDSVMFPGSTPVMHAILECFLLNLRPECNCKPEHIERTLASVVERLCKGNERSIWWQEKQQKNVHPFTMPQVAFFTAEWYFKLQVLRQLVEWQICHSEPIKSMIDEAWGVKHKITAKAKLEEIKEKEKKTSAKASKSKDAVAQSDEAGPSKEILEMKPIGKDVSKKRYWVVDDSPRVWSSGNPWKKATWRVETLSTTREELEALIASLQAVRHPTTEKISTVYEADHDELLKKLEERIPAVDAELNRIEQVMKRIQVKEAARTRAADLMQMRETRTRSKKRVDYAAVERGNGGSGEDDDGDQSDSSFSSQYDDHTDNIERGRRGGMRIGSSRESSSGETSLTSLSVASKRKRAQVEPEWRGERRSARLGRGPMDGQSLDLAAPVGRNELTVSNKKRRVSSPSGEDTDEGQGGPGLGVNNGIAFSTQPRLSAGTAHTSTDGDHQSSTAHSLVSDHEVPTRGGSILSDTSLSSLTSEDDM
ncbi:hypothetical protein FRB94_004442 [Tulasnella sp. JGI-2019a]|nr:hypothetical protein FRB93_003600 [Tulasnella sp. JGI-2019a]KAG9001910.1 hypothetical protein FRB94_004442 [Tulasnella sp. JGI-2019a]KAG9029340.1 hypothetical protein FRB95_005456 [Tulasnella sp. JGI-2019a]